MAKHNYNVDVTLRTIYDRSTGSQAKSRYEQMINALVEMAKQAGHQIDKALLTSTGELNFRKNKGINEWLKRTGLDITATFDKAGKNIESFSARMQNAFGSATHTQFFNFKEVENELNEVEVILQKGAERVSTGYNNPLAELRRLYADLAQASKSSFQAQQQDIYNATGAYDTYQSRIKEVRKEINRLIRQEAKRQGLTTKEFKQGDSPESKAYRRFENGLKNQEAQQEMSQLSQTSREQMQNLNQLISLQGQYNNAIRESNVYTESAQQATEQLVTQLQGAGININQEALASGKIEIDNLNEAAKALNITEEELALKLDTVNAKFESQQINDYITKINALYEAELQVVQLRNKKASPEEITAAENRVALLQQEITEYEHLHPNIKQQAEDLGLVEKAQGKYQTRLAQVNAQMKKTEGFLGRVRTSFKKMVVQVMEAGVAWRMFSMAMSAIRNYMSTIKDLDVALMNLRMATNATKEETKGLITQYNAMAKELGATTVDVAESANTWLRMGYSQADTNKLIKNSLVLSKVGMLDSAEATKYLVSAMKGFNIEAKDSISIVDKLSAVDMQSAVDAGGLAEALSRTAESANLAGVSLDKLIGYIATVAEVTQKDEASVGEGFKTLFSRLENVAANKNIDDEGESLNNVEKVLNRLGITLRTTKDEFRDMGDVLDDVADGWKDFTSVEKAQIATAVAGVRQRENFLVLMENYGKAQDYAKTSTNSAGTALEKFEAYEESLEYQTNKLKASLEGLANDFSLFGKQGDEAYASLMKVGNALVWFLDKGKLLSTTLITIASKAMVGLIAKFSAWIKQIKQTGSLTANLGTSMRQHLMKSMGYTITQLNDGTYKVSLLKEKFNSLTEAQQAASKAAMENSTAMQRFNAASAATMPILIGLTIAFAALTALGQRQIEKQQELFNTVSSSVEELSSLYQSTEEWATSLAGLQAELEKSNITGADYLSTQKSISGIKDEVVKAYQEQTNAVYDYNKSLEENIKLLPQASFSKWSAENQSAYNQALKLYGGTYGLNDLLPFLAAHPIAGMGSLIEDLIDKTTGTETNTWIGDYFEKDILNPAEEVLKSSAGTLVQISDKYGELYANLEQYQKDYVKAVEADDKELEQEAYSNISNILQQFAQTSIGEENPYIVEYIQGLINQAENLIQKSRIELHLDRAVQIVGGGQTTFKNALQTSIDEIFDSLNVQESWRNAGVLKQLYLDKGAEKPELFDYLTKSAKTFGVEVEDLINILANLGVIQKSFDEQIAETAGTLAKQREETVNVAKAIDIVKTAQEEYNENGYISIDTLEDLLSLDDEYIATLVDENGQLVLNTLATQDLLETKAELQRVSAMEALQAAVAAENSNSAAQIYSILGDEALTAAQKISALNTALAGGTISTDGWSDESKAALARYELVNQMYDAIKNGTYKGGFKAPKSSKSGSSSSKDPWLEAYKEELAELDHLKKMDKINTKEYYDELERLTHKYFTGRDKYHKEERENLEKLWDLYKQILDEEKERYETTLKYVDDVIDKKIEALEKEKETLEKKNKAQEDEIKLEKLQENLRKARQRTMRVYYEDVGKMSADNKGDYIG